MASPFRIFRKHQRWLLATVGLLAMIAFSVPSAMFMGGYGGGSSSNPMVVGTEKFGNLKERELFMMRERRRQLIRFVSRVQYAVRDNRRGEMEPLMASQRFLGAIGDASEKAVINTWLFAKEAESQGMVVSDGIVKEFLKELTDDSIRLDEFSKILEGEQISEPQLFDLLKYELSALRLQQMIQPSLPATLPPQVWGDMTRVPLLPFEPQGAPPRQRWDYFMRLKRQATIEVAAVKVAEFVDEQPEPSEKELKDFFEQHDEAFASPDSPEPGFRQPHRIAVRYFKANAEEFAKRENIPDDEVYKAYEEYKDFFDRMPATMFADPDEEEKPKDDDAPGEEGKPKDADAPAEKADAEPGGDKAKPESDEAKSDGDETKPDGDETKAEPSDDESPQPDKSSSATPSSRFRLASYLQEDAAGEEAAEDPEEKKEAPKEKEDEPKEDAAGDPESKEPAAGTPKSSALEPPKAPETPEAPKPKTREEVVSGKIGDFIRMQLLAPKKMDEVLNGLEEKMRAYRKTRNTYETDKLRNKDVEPPEELDFVALAKEHPGITTHQTELMSPLESIEHDIGKSFLAPRQQHPFVVDAYIENWQTYLPSRSVDTVGNQYLFWKNEDVEANVPKFEDVREEVLAAWKMIQSRKPAMEEAKRLAEKARNAGNPLTKALADEKVAGKEKIEVTETIPFSWMTVGHVPMMMSPAPPPRLSAVEGVEMPGDEFMETVFQKLEPGGVGTSMNLPKTVAYVIRVREINPPKDLLWMLFEIDKYDKYSNMAEDDIGKIIDAYRKELAAEAGVVWARQLDEPRE